MQHPYWEALSSFVSGKNILVFGLGLQGGGVGVANTLAEAGANVRVTDAKSEAELNSSIRQLRPGIRGTYGYHDSGDIDWAEIIIKNPGVPYDNSEFEEAREAGKTVVTEGIFALQFIRDKTIGITGTRGKSTTSALIHHILVSAGLSSELCGNIPDKPTLAALKNATADTWFVVEFSSFTLEAAQYLNVSPHIALVTNIYPDHLNRYASLEEYARTKALLFVYQRSGDHAIYGAHHPWTAILANAVPGAAQKHQLNEADFAQAGQLKTSLPGKHNSENIAFATTVAGIMGMSDNTVAQAVASFPGVPFRLQLVDERHGVRFINDTTSTTPIALEKALQSMSEKFILIAGGTSKKLPFSLELLEMISRNAGNTILLDGSGTRELLAALRTNHLPAPALIFGRLSQAVGESMRLAKEQGARVILFSPGFSSFEQFTNEFDRGRQFNELVSTL